jgi:hypothetical protein
MWAQGQSQTELELKLMLELLLTLKLRRCFGLLYVCLRLHLLLFSLPLLWLDLFGKILQRNGLQ